MNSTDSNEPVDEAPEEVSLGSLLHTARKERGIDLDEAEKATRIRRHNLEALEREQWDKLPSQVFVKGFLRSYAEFLGLDKELVLRCYERSFPGQQYQPRVLKEIATQPRRWRLILIISFLAVAFIAAIIYLRGKNISVVETAYRYLETERVGHEGRDTGSAEDIPALDEVAALRTLPEEVAAPEGEAEIATEVEPAQSAAAPAEEAIQNDVADEALTPSRLTLTARVHSRTWIAIGVDGQPWREYLLQPGETVEWTADEGFDILVGNAGGIEFSLNGDPLGYLGPEGKVVRLKLPE